MIGGRGNSIFTLLTGGAYEIFTWRWKEGRWVYVCGPQDRGTD